MRIKYLSYSVIISFLIGLSSCLDDSSDFLSPVDRLQMDYDEIDNYLNTNGINAQIDDRTGIRYVIQNQGTGIMPFAPDSATVSFSASFLNDTQVFEQARSTKTNWNFLNEGVRQALTKIQEGGSMIAYIPRFYAGEGIISNSTGPPDLPIIVDIGLEKVHSAQLINDIDAIEKALMDLNPDSLQKHPSGIFYTLTQGNGRRSTEIGSVIMNYSGRILGEADSFITKKSTLEELTNAILGWRIAIPLIKEGGSMTMYIPSPLGFGSEIQLQFDPPVPPNSILVFDIDLIMVN